MNSIILPYFNILKSNFTNPELELRVLLNYTTNKKKNLILSNLDIKDIDFEKFNKAFSRRLKKEPISKIFNLKNFWKYDFYVNQYVLDPRPDTELLIEKVLEFFPNTKASLKILDMCTGSGCLAISIAKEYLNAEVTATDISAEALKVARKNAINLECSDKINFIKCDLIKDLKKYDILVSNPPYLSNYDYKNISYGIKLYEPKIALLAKDDGYEFYERIGHILPKLMNINAKAFIEIGFSQANKAIKLLESNTIKCLDISKDINNLNRALILNKS